MCATVGKKKPVVKPKKPEHAPVTAPFVRPTPGKPNTPKVNQVAPAAGGIEVGTEVQVKLGLRWYKGVVAKTRVGDLDAVEYQINFYDGDEDSKLDVWRIEGKKVDNIKRI